MSVFWTEDQPVYDTLWTLSDRRVFGRTFVQRVRSGVNLYDIYCDVRYNYYTTDDFFDVHFEFEENQQLSIRVKQYEKSVRVLVLSVTDLFMDFRLSFRRAASLAYYDRRPFSVATQIVRDLILSIKEFLDSEHSLIEGPVDWIREGF